MATWDVTALQAAFEFDTTFVISPSNIIELDATHYMVAYTGGLGDGYVNIFSVDTATDVVTNVTNYEFDTDNGVFPRLYKISATKVLCIYGSTSADGHAVVLTINPADWSVTKGVAFEFDITDYDWGSIEQIDATNFLIMWHGGAAAHAYARILTVDVNANTVTTGGALFTIEASSSSALSSYKLDANHVLVVFRKSTSSGTAQVLEVNTSTWAVTAVGTPLAFSDIIGGIGKTAINKVDATHFMLSYVASPTFRTSTRVIEVNPTTWAITASAAAYTVGDPGMVMDTAGLVNIDNNHILLNLKDGTGDGYVMIIEVNTTTWETVVAGTLFEYDAVDSFIASGKMINGTDDKVLLVWQGTDNDGYVRVLTVEVPVTEVPVSIPVKLYKGKLGFLGYGTERIKLGKHYVTRPKTIRRR